MAQEARDRILRIILVHGRGTKPSKACKLNYIRQVLLESVRRIDRQAARWLEVNPQVIQLAYYADLTRRFLGERPEPCETYLEPIHRLMRESQSCPNWVAFRGLLKDLGADVGFGLIRLVSGKARLQWISEHFPDVLRYFSDQGFGSMVRSRLMRLLVPALREKARVLLLGHSLGSIVAYDCLWGLSHRPQYRNLKEKPVDLFITLGSPLGDETVKGHLAGWGRPLAQRYPTNIRCWVNLSARGDMICHDAHLANDFRPMIRHRIVERFEDRSNLCSVYRGRDEQWNPHKLYGYLILPQVGQLVADQIRDR